MAAQFAEAEDYHRKVLAMAQANAARHNMAGNARLALSQMHYHLAFCLEIAGKLEESETQYRQAIDLNPDNFAARVNFPILLLKTDRADEAWREFFTAMPLIDPLRSKFSARQWDGSDPSGKRILVSADGPFGDTLWLARFIPILRGRGAQVILQCQSPLLPLIGHLADEVIPVGADQPDFDYYAALAGLPLALGFTAPPQPSGCPYLAPPPDRRAAWKGRVPRDGVPNIGLVWAGSEGDRSRFRSHSIQIFSALARVKPARFFSLQKGPRAKESPSDEMALIDFTDQLRDFADTAALIEQLDLVVSIDTSVLHLAGAMNKPAFALIPWRNSFQWLLDRDDSPWYPAMKLFRQTAPNDWQTPARAMADAVIREISGRK